MSRLAKRLAWALVIALVLSTFTPLGPVVGNVYAGEVEEEAMASSFPLEVPVSKSSAPEGAKKYPTLINESTGLENAYPVYKDSQLGESLWGKTIRPDYEYDWTKTASIGSMFGRNIYDKDTRGGSVYVTDRAQFPAEPKYSFLTGMFYSTNVYGPGGHDWFVKYKLKEKDWLYNLAQYPDTKIIYGADLGNSGNPKATPYMTLSKDGQLADDRFHKSEENPWGSVFRFENRTDFNTANLTMIFSNKDKLKGYVDRPWAVLVDNDKPYVDGAYVTYSGEEGASRILNLSINEPVRFVSDRNKKGFEGMALSLQLADISSRKNIDAQITASYLGVDFENNTVQFEINDDILHSLNPGNKGGVEYQITDIVDVAFEYGSYGYDIYGITAGKPSWLSESHTIQQAILNGETVDSPITDVAGNTLILDEMSLFTYNTIIDTIPPKLTAINILERMHLSDSSTEINADGTWPKDISLSSVFAKPGDLISFSLEGDEEIIADPNSYIDLNLETGRYRVRVYRSSEDETSYGPLIITEDMVSSDGKPIRPIAISRGVSDIYGNPLDDENISADFDDESLDVITPNQQIYLDVSAPKMEAELIYGNMSKELAIGLAFTDKPTPDYLGIVSGFVGELAYIEVIGNSIPSLSYKYAFSDSLSQPDDTYEWKESAGPIELYMLDKTQYLHLKLLTEGDDTLTVKDLSLKVTTNDAVGNQKTTTWTVGRIENGQEVKYVFDNTAPIVSLKSMKSVYGDGKVIVKAEFNITELNDIDVWYSWDSWDETAENNQKASVENGIFKAEKIYSGDGARTSVLTLMAEDEYGNKTEPASYSLGVDLAKAPINYQVNSDTSIAHAHPEIIITSDEAPAITSGGAFSGGAITRDTYTRATLKTDMGDTYIHLVKPGETSDVFNFEGDWYEVTVNEAGDTYTSVSKNKSPEDYYGPLSISFDSAYFDLTPKHNGNIDIGESYNKALEVLHVKYAPIKEGVYSFSDWSYKDKEGNPIEITGTAITEGYLNTGKPIAGTRITCTLTNEERADWGLENIDFSKSYGALVDGDGNKLVHYDLAKSFEQNFAIPSVYENEEGKGTPFPVGYYGIELYIVQKGGNEDNSDKGKSIYFILDGAKPKNAGLWSYNHRLNNRKAFGDSIKYDIGPGTYSKTAEEQAFSSMIISYKEHSETKRNDLYSLESVGTKFTTIYLAVDDESKKLKGESVGVVKGIRAWDENYAEWKDLPYILSGTNRYNLQGKAYREYHIEQVDDELKGQSKDGSITVTEGSNTIFYQVAMENGNVSPVYKFTINVSDYAPRIDILMDGKVSKLDDGEGPTSLTSADIQITNLFSPNGGVRPYLLHRGEFNRNGEKEGNYVFTHFKHYDYSIGDENGDSDIIKIWGQNFRDNYEWFSSWYNLNHESYNTSNITSRWNKAMVGTMFLAVDDGGAMTYLTPQFRSYFDEETPETRYTFEPKILKDANWNYEEGSYHGREIVWSGSTENLDLRESTITFTGDGLPAEGLTLPAQNPSIPNAVGYEGGYIGYVYSIGSYRYLFNIANPIIDASHNEGEGVNRQFTFNAVGIAGDRIATNFLNYAPGGEIKGLEYRSLENASIITKDKENRGILIVFPTLVSLDGANYLSRATLPIYSNGDYPISLTDIYGESHQYDLKVDLEEFNNRPEVIFSTTKATSKPVTVSIYSSNYKDLVVTGEADKAEIIGSGTQEVIATVSEPSDLSVNYIDEVTDENGIVKEVEKTFIIKVDNISGFKPNIVWSYHPDDVSDDNEVTGPVTASLIHDKWKVIDSTSVEQAEYTFYPGGETSYTFSVVNGEEGGEPIEFPVELGVTLLEVPADPEADPDKTAPSIQLLAYVATSENGSLIDEEKLLRFYDKTTEAINPPLADYFTEEGEKYKEYNASAKFLGDLGWGSKYSFLLDTRDYSPVKLIVKEGLYAETPQYTDDSDSIQGVTLAQRNLIVSKKAAFTLFAVDSQGNATAVNMDVKNVGTAPEPTLVKTFNDEGARVYLMPYKEDEDKIRDLMLTGEEVYEDKSGGDYNGKYYKDFTDNVESYPLEYSYSYEFMEGKYKEITGTLYVDISEIDREPPIQQGVTKWSANRILGATNQNITAQLEFNKAIKEVTVDKIVDGMEVLVSGKQISVNYEKNAPAVELTCVSVNGKSLKITLNEVDNIDKTFPEVTFTGPRIAANGRSAEVTFTATERVFFQEARKEGNSFQYIITENGEHIYNFNDKAGNTITSTVSLDGLVKDPLKLEFSDSSDGAGKVINPSELELGIDDIIYIWANRGCSISFNDTNTKEYSSDWLGFEITEDAAGLYPSIYAVDPYKNSFLVYLNKIVPVDRGAPILALKKESITESFGKTKEEYMEILKDNASAFDEFNGIKTDIEVVIEFDLPLTSGTVPVTYSAKDAAGNERTVNGYLRLIDGAAPKLSINGESVDREGIFITEARDLKLTVDLGSSEAYTVLYKPGIKTIGQMKIGATELALNRKNAGEIAMLLDTKGKYTICLVTQERDYFRFFVIIK